MQFIVKKIHIDNKGNKYNVGDMRAVDNQHAIFHLKKYGLIADLDDEQAEKSATPSENKSVKPAKNK